MFEYNSNPFTSPFNQNNNSVDNLTDIYQKLESLKSQQTQLNGINTGIRNVFSDISKEWENTSGDERFYIENSKEYQDANLAYQNAFSLFLIEKLGGEFANSKHGKTAEDVLAIIRKKKENYKNKFAEDIEEIKTRNSELAKNNEILAKTNSDLQEKLSQIQKKFMEVKESE